MSGRYIAGLLLSTTLIGQPATPNHNKNMVRAEQIIKRVEGIENSGKRILLAQTMLAGTKYSILGGGPGIEERLSISIDGLDCMTSIESAIAAAFAKSGEQYIENIKKMRYDGEVTWKARKHYASEWLKTNPFLDDITPNFENNEESKTLSYLSARGIAPIQVTIRYIPNDKVAKTARSLKDGDIILFVSSRKDLDVVHAGVSSENGTSFVHASSMRGGIVQEDFIDYAKRYKGLIVGRAKKLQ